MLTPVEGASLATPSSSGDKGAADLTKVFQFQVQGDWSAVPVDVSIDSIELAAPNDAITSSWQKSLSPRLWMSCSAVYNDF